MKFKGIANVARYIFSPDDLQKSREDYAMRWERLDACLYRLCRENPSHDCYGSINAKVFIIGLTYETGIKRGIRTKNAQSSSVSQATDLLWEHKDELEKHFEQLAKVKEFSVDTAPDILEVHGRLVKILQRVTIDGRSPHSFVAKYMHFHNGMVPPYDGLAADVLPSLVPKRSIKNDGISIPIDTDEVYTWHLRRFLRLHNELEEQDLKPTVRSLDYYLVWKHDNP